MGKIKIAIIKINGLSSAGTEKFLQSIAKNLDKNKFEITFYYSSKVDYVNGNCDFENLNKDTLKEIKKHKHIKLISFYAKVDLSHPYKKWIETDFWQKFKEEDFDLIQCGKYSWPEYPFYKIKKTPIVDSVHYIGKLVDNQYNISKVIHSTNWQEKKWVENGGDEKRSLVINFPVELNKIKNAKSLRKKLKLNNKTVFGFIQRVSDGIFSKIPLNAYSEIENKNTFFIILGGSKLYSKQAKQLNLKNFKQLEASANKRNLNEFLNTLNIYAHGRYDGETFGTVFVEAMQFSLPIISHKSSRDNGHVETIGDAGLVCENNNIKQYSLEMEKLIKNKTYYKMRALNSEKRFKEVYNLKTQIKKIENLYFKVFKNPYPNKIRRILFLIEPIQLFKKVLIFIYFKWFKK